jgi:SAM-dependent methyltransferase
MIYEGLTGTEDKANPHVGGNVKVGDPFTFAPHAWNYLIERFALRSVLDLGSGSGYSAQYFNNAGMKVLAVDGLKENCLNAVYPTLHLDLTENKVLTKVDLVHCQEVVEHIEEKYIENLLCSMACGDFILMTNALPGQGGHHHVNEQPTEYWVEKLKKYGYVVLVEDTNRVRVLAHQDGATYLAQTGLVLTRLI